VKGGGRGLLKSGNGTWKLSTFRSRRWRDEPLQWSHDVSLALASRISHPADSVSNKRRCIAPCCDNGIGVEGERSGKTPLRAAISRLFSVHPSAMAIALYDRVPADGWRLQRAHRPAGAGAVDRGIQEEAKRGRGGGQGHSEGSNTC
jgi:hypothetical protein